MDPQNINYWLLCPMIFASGFVDAVAGGGGLISLPAYLLAGLPVHAAIATNKFASFFGMSGSTIQFWRGGHVRVKPALASSAGALLGAWLGAQLAMVLPARVLQIVLMVLLPLVALFLLFNRGFGAEESQRELPSRRLYPLAAVIGLAVGAYDGFFGPGAGTFLILAFTGLLGFDLIKASGSAKLVNLTSCVGSLAAYLMGGRVLISVGIPCAACAVAGSLLGSRLAIKNGARVIRPLIMVVIGLLFFKLLTDLIQGGLFAYDIPSNP